MLCRSRIVFTSTDISNRRYKHTNGCRRQNIFCRSSSDRHNISSTEFISKKKTDFQFHKYIVLLQLTLFASFTIFFLFGKGLIVFFYSIDLFLFPWNFRNHNMICDLWRGTHVPNTFYSTDCKKNCEKKIIIIMPRMAYHKHGVPTERKQSDSFGMGMTLCWRATLLPVAPQCQWIFILTLLYCKFSVECVFGCTSNESTFNIYFFDCSISIIFFFSVLLLRSVCSI